MKLKVLPLSLWISYAITRPKEIERLIPPHLQLAKVPLLETDKDAVPLLLFNAYEVESRWMKGHRVEVQTICVDPVQRSHHLVVLECLTDALQWDPLRGIRLPNARCTRKTDADGRYRLHVRSGSSFLDVDGVMGDLAPVEYEFVVGANRACYFRTVRVPLTMDFDPVALMRPVRVLKNARVRNTLSKSVRSAEPRHVFVHEQSMDFTVNDLPRRFG